MKIYFQMVIESGQGCRVPTSKYRDLNEIEIVCFLVFTFLDNELKERKSGTEIGLTQS